MGKIINAACSVCGNVSGYDEKSLKGSTWIINGCEIVLCCGCEDDLLKKIAKGRGIIIKYGDGGEIDSIKPNGMRIIHQNIKKIHTILEQHLMSDERDRVEELIEYV